MDNKNEDRVSGDSDHGTATSGKNSTVVVANPNASRASVQPSVDISTISKPEAHIIANPKAGQGEKGEELELAARVLRDAGWNVNIRFTEAIGHARVLAMEASKKNIDIVIAAGGDGTVNEITNALAGTPTALAVLPAGTGNVLAAQLGLIKVPTALHRGHLPFAADLLTKGVIRSVDVGLISAGAIERCFLLWAGIGFDAEVIYEIENQGRELKRKIGVGAFGVLGLRAATESDAVESVVTGDDWSGKMPLFMAVVANIPMYAGMMNIAEKARLDDCTLDLVLYEGSEWADKIRHASAVVTKITGLPGLSEIHGTSIQSRNVRIETKSPMRIHVDAETFGQTPVDISTLPGALRLLVPPSAPDTLFVKSRDDKQRCE